MDDSGFASPGQTLHEVTACRQCARCLRLQPIDVPQVKLGAYARSYPGREQNPHALRKLISLRPPYDLATARRFRRPSIPSASGTKRTLWLRALEVRFRG